MNDRWANYYNATSSKPPSRLLMRALEYVRKGNNTLTALDLGAGALVDSKFLLDQGFIVTAVDNSVASENLAKKINNPHFTFIKTSFDQFVFESEKYDLVTAQWALPFNDPKTFDAVL